MSRIVPPLHLLLSPEGFHAAYVTLNLPAFVYGPFVKIRTTELFTVLNLPAWLAEPVAAKCDVPTMATNGVWRLLVTIDRRPTYDELNTIEAVEGALIGPGISFSLPTTAARCQREYCWWARKPNGHVPLLSDVLDAVQTGHLWPVRDDRRRTQGHKR